VCIVLCATRKFKDSFDKVEAREEAQPILPLLTADHTTATHRKSTLSAAPAVGRSGSAVLEALPHIMKRSAWIQAHCRRMASCHDSAQDWQKALESIAHAWCRLLALVGLRW
jgi:hypothetical protein